MRFDIGFGTRNALQNGDAAYRQSQAEHDALLHKYEHPGQTPAEKMIAAERGVLEEKLNPKYWEDDIPRRDLNATSSWVDQIEYLPSLGIAILQNNGKQYYYPMTSNEVGDWMNSDSIGSYFDKNVKSRRG